jgi:hypothetical protein
MSSILTERSLYESQADSSSHGLQMFTAMCWRVICGMTTYSRDPSGSMASTIWDFLTGHLPTARASGPSLLHRESIAGSDGCVARCPTHGSITATCTDRSVVWDRDPVTLLDDIVAGATGDAPVASLLRQLKVLASRTGAGKLAEWVDRELDGYDGAEGFPTYRGPFAVAALGQFVGPFGRELKNFAIPPTTFPDEGMRAGSLFNYYAVQPIAEIERLAADGGARLAWSADVVRYYNWAIERGEVSRIVVDDMVLASVTQAIPPQTFIGIVDAVRTRVLDLALELERTVPDAGQRDAGPETNDRASRFINNYNFYGSANVAIESQHVTQTVQPPGPGDTEALIRYLGAAGVEPQSLVELRDALRLDEADDERDNTPDRWGRARAWFASASTKVTTNALGSALGAAATAFFASR